MTLGVRTRRWTAVAGLFVIVPLSVLAGILLSPDRLDELATAPASFVEPAQTTDFDERIGVVVTPEWTEPPALYAPAWVGTVGRVDIRADAELRSGDSLGSIDGVTRLAIATPEPFYRPLRLGDRGPDVVWLHDVLTRLGYLGARPPDASVVSATTVTAVRALAAALHVVGEVDTFDPGWFVWLPDEPYQVSTVALKAGAPAPPAGSVVAAGRMLLTGVGLARTEDGPLALQPDVGYLLSLADVEVPVDPVTTSVAGNDLPVLQGVLTPDLATAAGTISRAAPLAVWPIPTAAVMAGSDGRLCLWISGPDGFEAIPVTVLAARAGVTFVRPPAADGTKVLQNPAEVLTEPACPSA